MTAEQQARDILERLGVADAQQRTAGELVELANIIARSVPDSAVVHEDGSLTIPFDEVLVDPARGTFEFRKGGAFQVFQKFTDGPWSPGMVITFRGLVGFVTAHRAP